ncbi:MAG: rRNA maturation RNase YbeY [Muribaculaceae bacterium]|nr:rRNA maturation RNase YbeY [Muribaculaceae bacterium]
MISFDSININLPQIDFEKIILWLDETAASFQKIIGKINYIFCDDAEILRINRQFLNHDYFTDIITFDYSHKKRISGDIIISVETVSSNSKKYGESYENELLRVIVHGVLHLCGIKDKTPEERMEMERNENTALQLWQKISELK